jgi:hypothetical protein
MQNSVDVSHYYVKQLMNQWWLLTNDEMPIRAIPIHGGLTIKQNAIYYLARAGVVSPRVTII